MKSIALLIITVALSAFAGNGSGTMSAEKGDRSNSSVFSKQTDRNQVVLYQGESSKDVFIQYGTYRENSWKIDAIRIDKQGQELDPSVIQAIIKSKISSDWTPILPKASQK